MRTGEPKGLPDEEARYRLLVEAITDYAVYMLDAEGRVATWNPGARRLKGYEPSEIIGQHFSRFYTDQDRAAGLPTLSLQTAARQGRWDNEGWRVRKDGSLFWASVVIDPIYDPAGELIGFAKVTRDLTERKNAEEALRRSEEQFRLLVQGVSDYALYMLDPDGRVTNWNLGAQRIKGYLPEEIIGQHFSEFYTQADRDAGEPFKSLSTALREGRFEKEGWRQRKDGSRFWASVIIDVIRSETGAVLGFAKITRDITERRDAQLALEHAREALFQSQKIEAIGQLTGGVAHDFNNLLAAVLGSLELVRKRIPEDPRITPLLDNAIQGAERGASLTQRMLAFARRQELHTELVDITALVKGMTALFQHAIGPAVTLQTRFPPTLGPVLADANQLESALLNLVVNARDAMPEGGGIIISAREETVGEVHSTQLPSGRYLCLSVTDEGEGMDQATLARATEPFFTTKGVGKGTGLGLPMVLGLAEQSGGRLLVHSQKGKGTTVEIWLPLARKSGTSPAPEKERRAPLPTGTGPLRILAVDDDQLVLMNTAAMLEDLGHTVFEASSGTEAITVLRQNRVDVVITDQAMPQMTGTELASAVKSSWPDVPVILATGYAELPPGADPSLKTLSKPFNQEQLARCLLDALKSPETVVRSS